MPGNHASRSEGETYRFLLSCVRAIFDESTSASAAGPGSSDVDWKFLLELARENRVDVLLLHGLLRSAQRDSVPAETLAFLRTYEQQNRARNEASLEMLKRLVGALADQSIACLVFKGPLLGFHAYADPGMRFFWDLDFLVGRGDLPALHQVLCRLGFERDALSARQERLYMRYHFAHTYTRAEGTPDIDVHWSLFPANFRIPVDYRGLWARSVVVEVGGIHVRTFSPEDTVVYLALHGAKEEWRRLQMIADVAAMVAGQPDIDWQACSESARELRARRKFLLALHLAAEWLGAAIPPELRQEAASDRVIPRLADDVRRRQQRPTDRGTSIFRFSRWRMGSYDRRSDRVAYWWRTVSTPRLEHLALADFPLIPFFAYVPVRLLHDYVAVPIWGFGKRSQRRLGSRLR